MSDTIVVMNQGYIQQIGTPEKIYFHHLVCQIGIIDSIRRYIFCFQNNLTSVKTLTPVKKRL